MQEVEAAVQFGQRKQLRTELHLRGWAVVLGPGDGQAQHVHPMAVWSGVYYVKVPALVGGASSSGCLQLADPRPAAHMLTLGPGDAQFGVERTVCPETGLLVLFPSWLPHSVVHMAALPPGGATGAEAERIAVAFNVHGAEV